MHAEIAVIDLAEHGVYLYTWNTEEMIPSCDVHEETLKFLESKGHKRTHIKYIATDSGHLDIHDLREKGGIIWQRRLRQMRQ